MLNFCFFRNSARSFRLQSHGSVALIFGLSLLPLAILVGLAVDYSRADDIRTTDQSALDAAVISALSQEGAKVSQSTIQTHYSANGGHGTVKKVKLKTNNNTVSVEASATVDLPTTFGRLVKINSMEIKLHSEAQAPKKLSELQIRPITASGWFIKTVSLYATTESNPSPQLLGTVKYRPSAPTSGTGTMTDTFGGNWVTIADATAVWFELDIDPTSIGLWPALLMHLSSKDPSTSHHLFVDGKQMAKGVAVNLADIVPCGSTARHSWEDGGNWSAQDFTYEVTGKCDVEADGMAYLSK